MKKSIRQVTTSILIAVMLLLPGCANKEPDMVEQSPNTEGQTAPAAPAEEAEHRTDHGALSGRGDNTARGFFL